MKPIKTEPKLEPKYEEANFDFDADKPDRFYLLSSKLTKEGTLSECALCDWKKASKTRILINHVLSHLPEDIFPYKCGVCHKLYESNVYYNHMPTGHPRLDRNFFPGKYIRPEIAEKAISTLVACFPETEKYRNLTEDDLVRSPAVPKIIMKAPCKRKFEDGPEPTQEDIEAAYKYHQFSVKISANLRGNFMKNGTRAQCALCERELSDTSPPNIRGHVNTHLSEPAYRCPLCSEIMSQLSAHLRKKHTKIHHSLTLEQRLLINPRVAKEAVDVIGQCFPEFNLQYTPGKNMFIRATKGDKVEIELERVTDKNRAELEQLAKTYPAMTGKLTQDLFKKAKSGSDVRCYICQQTFWTHSKREGNEIKNHLKAHMSEKLYHCQHCFMPYNQWNHHKKRCQEKRDGPRIIRLGVIRAAVAMIPKCFPDYGFLLRQTYETLRDDIVGTKNETLSLTNRENSRETRRNRSLIVPPVPRENLAELTELGKQYKEKTLAVVKDIMKVMRTRNVEILCGKCPLTWKPETNGGCSSSMQNHFLTHLSGPAYLCTECGSPEYNIQVHAKKDHEDTKFHHSVTQLYPIRPEMAVEAFENFFQCLPDFCFS